MTQINYREEVANYKPQMTEAERMAKYMAGEEVDHLPFGLLSADECFANIYGYTTTDIREDFDKYAEVIERRIEDYDLHGIGVGLNLRTVGAAVGSELSFPVNGVDHVAKYKIPKGVDLDVASLEMPDPYNNPILTPLLELARKLKERFPDEPMSTGVCGAISAATGIRPVEALLKDTRKNPEEFHKLMDFCNEASLIWVETFVKEFGPGPSSIADPVACNDILGVKQFENLVFPYLSKMASRMEEITGQKPSLHICGHTKEIWPYLKELSISSFSVDNWEDIGETKDTFGDKMPIVGNVPPTDVLIIGTPEDVIESVKTCIKKAADSPNGYILNSGCQVAFQTPRENIDAYVYATRKYGAKAKKGQIPEAVYQD